VTQEGMNEIEGHGLHTEANAEYAGSRGQCTGQF